MSKLSIIGQSREAGMSKCGCLHKLVKRDPPVKVPGGMKLLGDAALVNGFWVCLDGFVLTRCGHIDVTIVPCLRR